MWSVKNVNQINLQSNNYLNNVTKANPWLAFIVYYNLRLANPIKFLYYRSIVQILYTYCKIKKE